MANTFENQANANALAAAVKARKSVRSLMLALDAVIEGKGNKANYTSSIATSQALADVDVDSFESLLALTT